MITALEANTINQFILTKNNIKMENNFRELK